MAQSGVSLRCECLVAIGVTADIARAPIARPFLRPVAAPVSHKKPRCLCASWRRDQSRFIPTLIGAAPWPAGADHEIMGLSERDAELVELFNLPTVAAKALPRS
jgi:hypothetical protein